MSLILYCRQCKKHAPLSLCPHPVSWCKCLDNNCGHIGISDSEFIDNLGGALKQSFLNSYIQMAHFRNSDKKFFYDTFFDRYEKFMQHIREGKMNG